MYIADLHIHSRFSRAHQSRWGKSQSRLVARENLEWI